MSRLIFDDIKTSKALGSGGVVTLLKSKQRDCSPFSEFDDGRPYGEDHFHLGDCPNLLSELDGIRTDYIRLAIFSVVEPGNGKMPFITFFIAKDDNGKWTFPVTRMRRDSNSTLNPELLNSFRSCYKRVGFFDDIRYRLPYAVYEVDTIANTSAELCGNALSCGMWATANELLSESILGSDVCDSVIRFISEIGQGIPRLYKNGKFIPAPQVYYTHDDIVRSGTSNGTICIGDLAYAIVQTFFVTERDDSANIPTVILNASENSGSITRVAIWGNGGEKDNYELESVVTGERYSYCSMKVQESDCCVLSSHLGSLTTDNMDAAEVLRGKMFIFE